MMTAQDDPYVGGSAYGGGTTSLAGSGPGSAPLISRGRLFLLLLGLH